MVVVLRLAPDGDQAVDRAAAAQHASARPIDAPTTHVGIWFGVETPIDFSVPHRLAVADRQMNSGISVAGASFQKGDAIATISRQAVGDHAARGATSNDYEVGLFIDHVSSLRISANLFIDAISVSNSFD